MRILPFSRAEGCTFGWLRMFKVFNLGVKPTLMPRSRGSAAFLPPLLLLLIAVATYFIPL